MAVNDIALVVGSATGAVTGIGALWLGIKKHQASIKLDDSTARVGDVEQRVAEWTAINDRVEKDNVRLRHDNDVLRIDNDRLRTELIIARFDVAELRDQCGLPEIEIPPEKGVDEE